MKSFRIMVVDDDKLSRLGMVKQLENAGYECRGFEGAYPALNSLETQVWDIVISDLRMPTMDGLQLLRQVKETLPDTEVIIITAFSSVDTAIETMHAGAVDYITKPFRFTELKIRLEKLEKIITERRQLRHYEEQAKKSGDFHGMIGISESMKPVFEKIRIFGPHNTPVLITGRTGSGKERVAQAIHAESGRNPFVAVPCGAIPKDLAESELFGHEKGAFTGAIQRRLGRFEIANNGTLFLDDVDDLPLALQPKLLRVLQEGRFERVGGEDTLEVDVRLIAASKKNLLKLVKKDLFREDLYYRLNVMAIDLPVLRERRDDILPLARFFLENMATREKEPTKSLSQEALNMLLNYDWLGNVRELESAIDLAHAMTPGNDILPQHLPLNITTFYSSEGNEPFTLRMEELKQIDLKVLLHRFEMEVIHWALLKTDGHQQKAADLLNIPRTTLQSKLQKNVDEID